MQFENDEERLVAEQALVSFRQLKQIMKTAPQGQAMANLGSLWYRQRSAAGRPIGSGLIEGANKKIVSSRLKLNSARWTVKHAEALAALRCLDYSGLWTHYWSDKAA